MPHSVLSDLCPYRQTLRNTKVGRSSVAYEMQARDEDPQSF